MLTPFREVGLAQLIICDVFSEEERERLSANPEWKEAFTKAESMTDFVKVVEMGREILAAERKKK